MSKMKNFSYQGGFFHVSLESLCFAHTYVESWHAAPLWAEGVEWVRALQIVSSAFEAATQEV